MAIYWHQASLTPAPEPEKPRAMKKQTTIEGNPEAPELWLHIDNQSFQIHIEYDAIEQKPDDRVNWYKKMLDKALANISIQAHPQTTPPPPGTLSPAEFMEKRGIDTCEIVSYFCRGGVGDGIDIDVEKLLAAYARHVAGVVARNVQHRAADYDSIHNVRDRFYEFIKNQTDLDPEIAEIVNENFWDLL